MRVRTVLQRGCERESDALASGQATEFRKQTTGREIELVAASAERCRTFGYEYLVAEATNQWSGAAFEALGGVRVHFRPFLVEPAVPKSAEPLEDVTTSPNGFLADKDSGGMFYVIRFA